LRDAELNKAVVVLSNLAGANPHNFIEEIVRA
jgi:hypothetical protein